MTDVRRIGLLGGTFDPIHYGHLDAADAARTQLALDEVRFIPSNVPPHRQIGPSASGYHRFALVALAIEGRPGCRVSPMELEREGHSFTMDTLRRLHRDGLRPSQLFFILGADAFAEIATWHAYPDVLDAAHFVVIARPGATSVDALTRTPALARRVRLDVAGSARGEAAEGSAPETGIFLVEARTRDVSSTAIRARLAAGHPIDDLVPAAVASYVEANDLYRTVNQLHG
jgi:nicotinate-nucleotide adenylyltransferase